MVIFHFIVCSTQRPIKLAAWNRYSENEGAALAARADGFPVMGFVAVCPVTNRGIFFSYTLRV